MIKNRILNLMKPISFQSIQTYKRPLAAACIFSCTPLITHAADQPKIESEAHRLERIKTIISQEKHRRLSEIQYHPTDSTPCETMLSDLLNSKRFKPIEPAAVLNHEYPVRSPYWTDAPTPKEEELSRKAEEKLGPWLSQSLQRCATEEADGNERKTLSPFNAFNYEAGAPPFRIYLLPEKINPLPPSQLMYWSEYSEKSKTGRIGYSWVNLNNCTQTWGSDALSNATKIAHDPDGQVSVLTSHREGLAIWTVSRGFMFHVEYYNPKAKPKKELGITNLCSWETYKEGT